MRVAVLIAFAALASLVSGCAQLAQPWSGSAADTAATAMGTPAEPAPRLPPEFVTDDLIGFVAPGPLPDPLPPAKPDDLWDRIRDGFAMPDAQSPAIDREVAFFASRQEYINRVAQRAEPYLHFIVDELEQRNMPTELALLPIVESAFRPFAYSHGRAAGIWQFVPATARHFGLKQNWWYDGRRDVIAATDAALDYLQQLNDMFNGDWLLAVAAYNAGEGNVQRAVRYNERHHRPTDFWHLNLPRETESYVPRLLALRDVVRTPEAYGLTLPSIPDQPQIAVVKVDTQIDLALAADLAGISIDELYRLNPGYNRWATAPSGPHRLVLPVDRVDQFEEGLAATPESKLVQWHRHRVRRGETLIAIASHYHTTVNVLRQVNGIHGNLIRAGKHLIVPVASRPSHAYSLSVSQRLAALRGRSRSGRKHIHTVRRGDTLWDISRQYGVTVRQVGRWNQIAPGDPLRPGRRLVIWTRGSGSKRVASSRWRANNRLQSVHYTVRRGDSLYAIAQRFNVRVSDLRRWNSLSSGKYLQPGQKLKLQVDVTAQNGI